MAPAALDASVPVLAPLGTPPPALVVDFDVVTAVPPPVPVGLVDLASFAAG